MASPFANLALSLRAVAVQADAATTAMRTAAIETNRYGDIIADFASKTFAANGGLDIGQAIKTQAAAVDAIRRSGPAGDALEQYAAYAKRLAEPGVTPQMGAYFSEWMIRIEDLITRFGGAAGRDFSFNTFRTEIQDFVRRQQKLLKQQQQEMERNRRRGTSGTAGTQPNALASGTATLSVLTASGALR